MGLSGCFIPLNYYENFSRHSISDKTQSLLRPGVTTKEEVFLLLGEPDIASKDGQSITYIWTKVYGWYLLYFEGRGGEVKRCYVLEIKFDSDNRVVGVDLKKTWIGL